MNQSNSTSKRLAKNTAFMYIRMIFLMGLSFYTSRVILQQLGVNDYGIYNVVGSIVAMFSSLRTIFATSTQRFLNYEMGANSGKLDLVFSISTIVNLIIGLVFVFIVEIVGIWFLNTNFNADPYRLFAANCVLHFSVASAFLSIMTTPYDAVIIAHERMDFYAYMSIFEGILKLLIVFLLIWSPFDKLIYYATLNLLVALIIRLINSLYCKRHFSESKFKFLWDKKYFKQMFAFAGWNFLGNTAYSLTQNGLNMVLNVFGGPVVNAARGLAYQILGSINQVSANINIVISPYCIKTHAEGNDESLFSMTFFSSKVLFIIQAIIVIPFLHLSFWFLDIWLMDVPEYTVPFVKLVMLYSLFRSLHGPIDTLFKSFGKLKYYQICEGIILTLPVVCSYIFLKNGASYITVFVLVIVFDIVNSFVIIPLVKHYTGLNILGYLKKVILPCILVLMCILLFYILNQKLGESLLHNNSCSVLSVISSLLIMWFIGFSKQEQNILLNLIKRNEK